MGCGSRNSEDARMSRFIYTKEMIDYIREIAPGRFNDEITEMFNKKFNLNKTIEQINSTKKNHKITSGKLPKRKRYASRLLNKEQSEFLKNNVKGISNEDLARLMNKKFGLSLSKRQVMNYKGAFGLSSGLTGHFEKGMKPWNKGMKGLNTSGGKGWFKKGDKRHNQLPIGTEVIVDEGYKETKIAEPNVWKRNHIMLWEKENGDIPQDYVVIFLDKDKTNITIENLAMLHRRELAMMNRYKLFSEDAEITLSGIALVRLKDKLNEAEHMDNDREKYYEYMSIAEDRGIGRQTFIQRIKRGWSMHDATYKPLHAVLKQAR